MSRTPGYVGLGVGADYIGDTFWKIAHRPRPQAALNEDLLKPFFWQYSQARTLPVRFSYGQMVFATDRLKNEGFRPRFGLEQFYRQVISRISETRQ